jgi:1-phosphofructokinase
MILTVTPNPSVDRALDVQDLEVGEVNRALRAHLDAGGKGINISRAFVLHGIDTVAVFPAGGPDGALLTSELTTRQVTVEPVPIEGTIRSNITLVDAAGETTKINAPGPTLSGDEREALLAAVDTHLAGDVSWVVGAGSLPAGVGADFYVQVADRATAKGVRFALDTSGEPFAAAAAAGGMSLIKPNEEELGDLLGRELTTVGEVVDGAREVMAGGTHGVIDAALVSLGAAGALLVTPDHTWWAAGPPLVPLSTVGAGDTTLAGYLSVAADPDHDPADALRTAIAWGRAAVLLPGSAAPGPEQIDLAAVTVVAEPDSALPLKELHV